MGETNFCPVCRRTLPRENFAKKTLQQVRLGNGLLGGMGEPARCLECAKEGRKEPPKKRHEASTRKSYVTGRLPKWMYD